MPFTLAHAAAALPFRRTGLDPTALVIGTMAPDFEYFVLFAPSDDFGHTLRGLILLALPLALVVLLLFQAYVKEPTFALFPQSIQRRLPANPESSRFWTLLRLPLIVLSILIGAATHILWDSFTHPRLPLYRYWSVLSNTTHLPLLGTVHYYNILQHLSTLIGGAALLLWFRHWYRTTAPNQPLRPRTLSHRKTWAFIFAVFLIATLGGLLRAYIGAGIPSTPRTLDTFAGKAVVTAMTSLWLELLLYGIAVTHSKQKTLRQLT